jgi:urease accessory protein
MPLNIILLSNTPILHLVNPRFGDFYTGMIHVLTSLDHILPVIAIGLLAGQRGPVPARKTLVAFTLALFSGAWIGYLVGDIKLIEYTNIGSFILFGLLVALNLRISGFWILIISVIFGLTHGFTNGTAITETMVPLTFIAGVGLAGFLVMSIIAGLVLSLNRNWEHIAVRVLGSWIAAIGIIYIPLIFMD